MIIPLSITNTDSKLLSIPHGRVLRIYGMTVIDKSGAANTITLHDKGNYYDGTDFSSTYDIDIDVTAVGANATQVIKFEEPRDVMNELWGVGTGAAEVILNAEYL